MQDTHSEDTFHVLIAGDDAAERQAAGRALQQSGLPVQWQEAASFADAWQCLEHSAVDAVLVHFRETSLAGDGGSAAFLRQAKQRALPMPLILFSDSAEETAAADWLGAGASDLIPRSLVSPESLARALQNVRRLRRAQMQIRQAEGAHQQSEARFRRVADSNIIGIVFWETDGTISDANDAFLAMIGYSQAEMQEGALNWHALTPPEQRSRDSDTLGELVRTAGSATWEKEMLCQDGSRVVLLVSASFLEPEGRKGLAFVVDVTERKRAQDAQKFLAEAGAALSASPRYVQTLPQVAALATPGFADWCLIDLVEDGLLRRMASVQSALMPPQDAENLAPFFSLDTAGAFGPAHVMQTGIAELHTDTSALLPHAAGRPLLRSFLCAPLIARERILGTITLAYGASGRCHTAADLPVAEQMGHRIALAVDNARYLFDTQARAEREAVVNAIGQTLRGSLDAAQILLAATRALGEALGVSRCFWCWVPVSGGDVDVAPQQYAAQGTFPSEQIGRSKEAVRALSARLSGGEPLVVSGSSDPVPGETGGLPELDKQVFIAAPVPMRGEWSGLLVVEQMGSGRQWTAAEETLVRQVGGLLGPALENARLYEREHRVADMLQAAFLCNVPDQLSGLELATVYRAGLSESQVGGDCYDVFPLPDGRVALVIADVSGKGLGAAVVTATVKFSLRAFAAEVAAPSLALTRLNRMLCNEASGLGEHFVTLFYAVFDPAGGRLLYASAGHETQLIKRAAGGSAWLGSTGPILGIADHLYEQREERLNRGDALILFTDGLTEARSPQTRELLDLDRVTALVERLPAGAGAGALTVSLEQLALDWAQGRPHDDMALLVARRMPLPIADIDDIPLEFALPEDAHLLDGKPEAAGLECLFRLSFPSRAGHAADVRQAVAHWMETLGYDRPSRDDFLTAVTEAVTNAVLHGSPAGEADKFCVAAFRGEEEGLAVEVLDRGPGLSSRDTSPPMPGPEAVHGRGLPLMREFTHRVEYLPTQAGLCVRLHTRRMT